MNGIQRESILKWRLAGLAIAPVALYAYLGHFSRLMSDDYCYLARSREFGLWDALVYYYTVWNSSYTQIVITHLLAPLDTALSAITPVALVLLWCACSIWAFRLVMRRMQFGPMPSAGLFMLVFLLVSASIYGMLSHQSFYWYFAAIDNTLAIPALILCIGFAIRATSWPVSSRRFVMAAIICCVICFLAAGMAEIYLVFLFTLLAGLMVATILFQDKSLQAKSLLLLGAGCLGTSLSAVIQLVSPGIYARMQTDIAGRFWLATPVRTLPELLKRTVEATFEFIGHQEAFAGFMLALFAAMFLTLSVYRPRTTMENSGPPTLSVAALWASLITQLLLAPVLWTHTSDSQQIMGRYSAAYFIVVCINVIQILAFAFLLACRRQVTVFLSRRGRWPVYITALTLVALALFTVTQARSIHFRAATYLFISSFVLLCNVYLQLKVTAVNGRFGRMIWLPFFLSGITLACYVNLIGVSLFLQGFVVGRSFAATTHLHVISGAVWGAGLGCLLRQNAIFKQNKGSWVAAWRAASLIAVLAIGSGIVFSQLRMLPRLRTFATEWDERHAEIIRQRDSGSSTIVAPELSYDFGYDLVRYHIFDTQKGSRCSAVYYGVESIIRTEDDG